ncbi:hypothetical protein [Peribacillus sp. SCS-155]|uniref:hypothetical protein n=1 Tax=Peribacillus sedimenti TaxID=3115297 RepID=UPI0039063CD0
MGNYIRHAKGELLDILQAQDKMLYFVKNYLLEFHDFEGAKTGLENLHGEMSSYFIEKYEGGKLRDTPYWFYFFEILSNITHSLAICHAYLKEPRKAAELADQATTFSMILGAEYQEKIETLMQLVTWAYQHKPDETPSPLLYDLAWKEQTGNMEKKIRLCYNALRVRADQLG